MLVLKKYLLEGVEEDRDCGLSATTV